MSATSVVSSQSAATNRRRRVRQKAHAPAYATFKGASRSEMLDLYEVLDISEVGVALQCPSQMEINQSVDLCLDLAEARGQISVIGRVVWSDSTGRVGLAFPALKDAELRTLREWLFLNAMAGAANASPRAEFPSMPPSHSVVRPNYSDTLNAASAVQREAESLGSDLEAVLSLVARRSMSMLQASGAAIALAGKDAGAMTCRASAGTSAPPIGATLQIGSGFSGDCVRSGKKLRCDDTDIDDRVDPENCRALGIRSMLASPIGSGQNVVGLLEVFSSTPGSFSVNDADILQLFADTVLAAINRSSPRGDVSPAPPPPAEPFSPRPGSILFASDPKKSKTEKMEKSHALSNENKVAGVHLPRAHLYLLVTAAATIFLALGFVLAPWIQETFQGRGRNQEPTVLASSRPPVDASQSHLPNPPVDPSDIAQLRELARQGNPAAENAMGLLYAQGDDKQSIKQDEVEAAFWFSKAAEHGSVPAQYKLSLLYWGGHGVFKDIYKAYFWAVLARAGGQQGSQDLAKVLASGIRRAQAAAIERQADLWYQQHASNVKPNPGH